MHWMIKAGVQRMIGALPYRRRWYEIFQKYVSRSLELPESTYESKLKNCRRHLERLEQISDGRPFTVFELGTGWFPVLPIGMFLCGAKDVWTCDIEALLKPARVRHVLNLYIAYAERGDLEKFLPGYQPERVDLLREVLAASDSQSAEQILKPLGIHPLVADARTLPLPDGSIDFIESNSVFEYLPPGVLAEILTEFKRILRPEGGMSHYITLRDEYSFFDPKLSPFNYLRFSDAAWRRISNPFTPLTRLRIDDYRQHFEQAGFEIQREENVLGDLADLQRVPLAPRFQGRDQQDMLVLISWLLLRPAGRAANRQSDDAAGLPTAANQENG